VLAPAHAQSDVYVCMNDNGTREYKNTGETRGCKRVDMQGISMIPSPYKKPLAQTAALNRPAGASATSSPSDFPKIDSSTQKARDTDRMQILAEELKGEERKLAAIKQEYNNGEPERRGDERNYAKYQDRVAALKDDLSRTEKNIEALTREIGNLK
jgi:septal ring factor EnvC (AmiA/AmiB activator)